MVRERGARRGRLVAGVRAFVNGRPMLRFVVLVCVMMGAYFGVMSTGVCRDTLFPAYLRVNADLSAWVLRVLGHDAEAAGVSVISPQYSLSIARGCDAIDPSALFAAGVLALQVPLRAKVPGLVLGTLSLLTINLVRIVSLFFVGIHFPKAFHVMHVDVWQPAFIVLAIGFWAVWAIWATRPVVRKSVGT